MHPGGIFPARPECQRSMRNKAASAHAGLTRLCDPPCRVSGGTFIDRAWWCNSSCPPYFSHTVLPHPPYLSSVAAASSPCRYHVVAAASSSLLLPSSPHTEPANISTPVPNVRITHSHPPEQHMQANTTAAASYAYQPAAMERKTVFHAYHQTHNISSPHYHNTKASHLPARPD